MTSLREAAQAVLDRWDSPAWEWSRQGPTAELMAALRAALQQDHDAELSAALGWPGGISDPVLDRKTLLRKVAELDTPLTDEQIDRITDQQWALNNHKPIYAAHRAYARAIERARGIGGQDEH